MLAESRACSNGQQQFDPITEEISIVEIRRLEIVQVESWALWFRWKRIVNAGKGHNQSPQKKDKIKSNQIINK